MRLWWGGYLFNRFFFIHMLWILSLRLFRHRRRRCRKTHTTGRRPFIVPPPVSPMRGVFCRHMHAAAMMMGASTHGVGLTADGEERVGLLAGHRGHALQRVEAAAADVDPALHLRLAKEWAEERDGDDVELLLGGVHLLRAPAGGERRFAPLTKGKKNAWRGS